MIEQKEPFFADMVGDRLIVWDHESSRHIYKMGYFGKPVGIPKPKDFNFNAPLSLDLIEGLYLLKRGLIRVFSGRRELNATALQRIASRLHEGFSMKYIVYEDLRKKEYVVTPGIKFGCDFAVYEFGPGIDHAPFLILVMDYDDFMTAPDLVRAGRLATTVKKRFVFAVVKKFGNEVTYLVSKWWKA